YPVAIIIVYVFVLYTTFGGMFSIAKSDGFNSFIIIVGVMVAITFILEKTQGISAIMAQAKLIEGYAISGIDYYTPKGSLLQPLAGGNMTLLSLVSAFFGWGLGLAANPQYTVRIIAAKDDQTAKRMIARSIIILAVTYVALAFIGLGSRVLMPSVENVDSMDALFPYVFNAQFPSTVSGIILMAIMAAAISTANSQLLVVSGSFVYDIYRMMKPEEENDDKLLLLSRVVVFFAGSMALILAFSPPESLIVYGGYVWGVFSAVFFLPLYGGIFWPRATRNSAMFSMIAGLLTMLISIFVKWHAQSIFDVNPALPSVIVAGVVFWIVAVHEESDDEVKY
ncbi:MAG: sodium:solute symporter family protein, partial [Clostridia bacterium]|nr:sodium:solute symporter family protein [Clostridia bacterium]